MPWYTLEELIERKERCIEIANELAAADDVNLSQFYFNAAYGYLIKMKKIFGVDYVSRNA